MILRLQYASCHSPLLTLPTSRATRFMYHVYSNHKPSHLLFSLHEIIWHTYPTASWLDTTGCSDCHFLQPEPTVTLLSYMSPLYLALSLSLFNCLLHCFCSFFLNSLRTEIIVPYFYHISVPSTEPNTEYLSNKYELHE